MNSIDVYKVMEIYYTILKSQRLRGIMRLLSTNRREIDRNRISKPTLLHYPRTYQSLRVQFQFQVIRIVFQSLQAKGRRVVIWISASP